MTWEGDVIRATYAGQTYQIPGIWLAGYCRNGRTVLEAIQWWHYQATLEKAYLGVASTGARRTNPADKSGGRI